MAVNNKDQLNGEFGGPSGERKIEDKGLQHSLQINYAGHVKCHFEYEI